MPTKMIPFSERLVDFHGLIFLVLCASSITKIRTDVRRKGNRCQYRAPYCLFESSCLFNDVCMAEGKTGELVAETDCSSTVLLSHILSKSSDTGQIPQVLPYKVCPAYETRAFFCFATCNRFRQTLWKLLRGLSTYRVTAHICRTDYM